MKINTFCGNCGAPIRVDCPKDPRTFIMCPSCKAAAVTTTTSLNNEDFEAEHKNNLRKIDAMTGE